MLTIDPRTELLGFIATDDLMFWEKLIQIGFQGLGIRCLTEGFVVTVGPKDGNAPLALVHIDANE
ncbi:hypothetical protein AAGF08_19475 [Algoriphagus sp. SE2]|uniref:hypothetical protein n=1 Tax=Algoriphagus sp. SE2 TaxID=3141536 RepID=UPI0031CDA265